MLTAVVPLVCVVDDDLSVRKSLSRLLTLAGYRVEAFQSAREFLTREVPEGPCCLVLGPLQRTPRI
jgi:FixJ family two-component response regulator